MLLLEIFYLKEGVVIPAFNNADDPQLSVRESPNLLSTT